MNSVTESDISSSTQAAWKAVFGSTLSARPPKMPAKEAGAPFLVASVQILGGEPRAILVQCPVEEARKMAATFFRMDPASVARPLVNDVFGELANMIGGLIKRHFHHSARLSLPEVHEASSDKEGGRTLAQAVFSCGSGPLAVRLVINPS